MNFLNTMISENVINALGWTIIHSLWQGAAVALGFALVMFFMRQYSARTRYIIGVMAMVLILAMSIVTFANLYETEAAAAAAIGPEDVLTGTIQLEKGFSLAAFFKDYFNRHLPLVVTLWMLGVLVLMLRFAGGFLYNQRIKTHHAMTLPESWQNLLQRFCRQAGIRKTVGLVESALIKVPMTIGHMKPVILMPIGLVTGMPRDQVEALLAHELAHIMRRDYLFNIIQNFIDILFFYHPGVRWTSALVRTERENCCDDIAVSLCGGSLNVARALSNIHDYRPDTLDPAMAATGGKTGSFNLLARVKRLLNPPALGSRLSEGVVGASILVIGLLTLVLSANAAATMNSGNSVGEMEPIPISTPVAAVEADKERTARAEKEEEVKQEKLRVIETELAQTREDAKKQKMKLMAFKKKLASQNRELTDEEQRIFDEMRASMKSYEETIKRLDQLLRDFSHSTKSNEAEQKRKQEEFLKKREVIKLAITRAKHQLKDQKTRETELNDEEKKKMTQLKHEIQKWEQKRRQIEEFIKSRKLAARKDKQEELEKARKKLFIEKELAQTKLSELLKKQMETKKLGKKLPDDELKRIVLLKDGLEKWEQKMKQVETMLGARVNRTRELADKLHTVFVKEMLADKLIENAEHFEVKLRLRSMHINGKKQPDTVYKKYKKIYESVSGKPLVKNKSFIIRQ